MTPVTRYPTRRVRDVDAPRLTALARLRPGLFTRQDSLAAGLSACDLRSDVVTPVVRGVFLAGGGRPVSREMRCAAEVLRCGSGSVIAGFDAARLWRLPIPDDERLHISVPEVGGRTHRGVQLFRRSADVRVTSVWVPTLRQALPVTALFDVLPETEPQLSLVDAVVLADACLMRVKDVRRCRDHWTQRAHNRPRLRDVTNLARCGAESPMETKLRLLLGWAGLGTPTPQVEVSVDGRRFRFDLAYEEHRIAIEYDGAYHFESEAQKHADVLRLEQLTNAGWRVIRVVSRGILRDPVSTIARVRTALEAAGATVRPRDEWREHFAQRDPIQGYVHD